MIDPNTNFFQARLKLFWADQHVRKAYGIWQAFLQTDFCEIGIEDQFEGEKKIGECLIVRSVVPLPAELILTIGDAVHNMRAALDYTVSEILHWKDTRITFPMGETRDELVTSFRTEPEIVGSKTRKKGRNAAVELAIRGIGEYIVEKIRPYKGGHPTLWALGKLDNTDKHRLLIPVLVPQTISDVDTIDDNNNRMSGCSVTVGPGGICRALMVSGISGFKIQRYGKPTAEIFFNEIGIIEGQPAFPALSAMLRGVNETISGIDEFVTTAGWNKPAR
jgi:hypothetical protein